MYRLERVPTTVFDAIVTRKRGTMKTLRLETATRRNSRSTTVLPANQRTISNVQWRKGWTPWGTPCGVLMVDGYAHAAHATEKSDCPLARLAK
jgi:hypothetical protein